VIGDILQPTHLLFVLVIALLVLGPKRLPEVGRSLGKGIRDFKGALGGDDHDEPEIPAQTQYTPPGSHTAEPSTESTFAQHLPGQEPHTAAEVMHPASAASETHAPAEALHPDGVEHAPAQTHAPATAAPQPPAPEAVAPPTPEAVAPPTPAATAATPPPDSAPTEALSTTGPAHPAQADDTATQTHPAQPAEQHVS
jgi:sec-independent protein translocase protein TatA